MDEGLSQELARLDLKPGQCRCFQVNGYDVEVRRPADEESAFAIMAMLEPWIEFPRTGQALQVPVRFGKLPLPDPPEIPSDLEEDES